MKKINNIYFIEAKSPGANIFSKFPMPRLGSILLATILKNKGYNTKVFIEDIAKLGRKSWKILKNADIICISSITDTALRAFQIAERFKELGIPVVMGGPHSTFLPNESLQHADYVVRGEGEKTIVELIENLKNEKSLDSILGLSFRDNCGCTYHNPDRALLNEDEHNNLPIPDFALVYNWDYSLVPVSTSRGCPFACKFCSVIQMFGREYRYKKIDKVVEEIHSAILYRPGHVFFIDDNFAANKGRTKELLRAMIAAGIHKKIRWSAQVRTDIARDPELVALMAEAGCFAVYIGFESINPETLKLYGKGQTVKDIENSIHLIQKYGINIHGMFVLGADTDTVDDIRKTKKFAVRLKIDSIQFMNLTPLPGTPVFQEMREKGRLLHTSWNKYDAHHAVFEPMQMSARKLHFHTLWETFKFYGISYVARNILKKNWFYMFVGFYGFHTSLKSILFSLWYLREKRFGKKFEFTTDKT